MDNEVKAYDLEMLVKDIIAELSADETQDNLREWIERRLLEILNGY